MCATDEYVNGIGVQFEAEASGINCSGITAIAIRCDKFDGTTTPYWTSKYYYRDHADSTNAAWQTLYYHNTMAWCGARTIAA